MSRDSLKPEPPVTAGLSFTALFLSVALLQLGAGGIAPLDALGGLALGFSRAEVGLLGSAHFIGFFVGCWIAPRLMGRVGHSRSFAAFAACGVIGAIAHPLWMEPLAWSVMRVLTGVCIAGCYTVVEAWMNASVTNNNRGRVLGAYRSIDLLASLGAQMLLLLLVPAVWLSYNVLAIVCCACLLPLMLSTTPQPVVEAAPRLRPFRTLRVSPLGAIGALVAGLTAASFRMVGPIYAADVGLAINQTAVFLSAFVLGGAISQFPMGWVADRYDRRWVMIAISLTAVLSCLFAMVYADNSVTWLLIAAFFFGFTTFPLYSLASAHANDFSGPSERIETAASLLFLFGVGAIGSPYLSARLIDEFGPAALFAFVASAHTALAVFGLFRMQVRPTREARTPYRYVPRTSYLLGRLIRRGAGRPRK